MRPQATGWRWAGLALALCLLAPAPVGAAEVRTARAVGAVPAPQGGAGTGLRAEAQRVALLAAVAEAAVGMLPPEADPATARPQIEAALGRDPFPYTARYRVLDDRGVGPRQVLEDPAVTREYAMEVEAQIDVARVREKLVAAGLVAVPRAVVEPGPVDLVLEGVSSIRAYEEVRRILVARLGARSAVPREFSPSRVVLRISGGPPPEEILAQIASALPADLQLEALPAEGRTLRARLGPRGAPADAPGAPASD